MNYTELLSQRGLLLSEAQRWKGELETFQRDLSTLEATCSIDDENLAESIEAFSKRLESCAESNKSLLKYHEEIEKKYFTSQDQTLEIIPFKNQFAALLKGLRPVREHLAPAIKECKQGKSIQTIRVHLIDAVTGSGGIIASIQNLITLLEGKVLEDAKEIAKKAGIEFGKTAEPQSPYNALTVIASIVAVLTLCLSVYLEYENQQRAALLQKLSSDSLASDFERRCDDTISYVDWLCDDSKTNNTERFDGCRTDLLMRVQGDKDSKDLVTSLPWEKIIINLKREYNFTNECDPAAQAVRNLDVMLTSHLPYQRNQLETNISTLKHYSTVNRIKLYP